MDQKTKQNSAQGQRHRGPPSLYEQRQLVSDFQLYFQPTTPRDDERGLHFALRLSFIWFCASHNSRCFDCRHCDFPGCSVCQEPLAPRSPWPHWLACSRQCLQASGDELVAWTGLQETISYAVFCLQKKK